MCMPYWAGLLVALRVFRAPEAPQASRRPPIGRGVLYFLARPHHRPRAPQPGPASGGSPVPSGPSGALHTGGAWSASISHVIPLGLFQVLNRDRCYFNISGCC